MEAIFTLNMPAIASFLLTLIRISLLVFMLPFYGGENIPSAVKGALCIMLAMAVWPHLAFSGSSLPAHPLGLILLVFGELLVGLMLGLFVHFIFAGIQTGGQLMGFQMGFSMMQVADPMSGQQISGISHLLYMVAVVVFLTLDGHLFLLQALTSSFAIMPPGGFFMRPALLSEVITLSGQMFILAVKVAGPILAALFLIELALALMARAAPQMNLLIIGMPIKIAVGFFFMFIVFALLARTIEDSIYDLGPVFRHLLQLSAPE
ncbi:Flagellar biosynthetic protein fliR [uncultured delta proteobacterium]|uniref:Flagellar biosynthetic protein FliR n=1 Tax=uncultured delta proteobacterium TaxID=34034 RepID=A0A212ITZ5_9DELT|nr:Flagellar biosynthetic protein fliR [uncultured delta proteobacterium]